MMKLFAILTVLAALPVSALAEQVQLSKNSGIHCAKDAQDKTYIAPVPVAAASANSGDAQVAR